MQCLNIKHPEVKAALDELTETLGSYSAAYYVLAMNNGYSLDKAPNGALSKLYQDLLAYYKGDKLKTALEKAKLFTRSFRLQFGDWLSQDNGEPALVVDGNSLTYSKERYDKVVNDSGKFTSVFEDTLSRNKKVETFKSTKDLAEYILTLDNIDERTRYVLSILKETTTGIEIKDTPSKERELAAYNGNLILYRSVLERRSNNELAEDVAHELMHHYFAKIYDTNAAFREKLTEIRDKYRKKISNYNDYYGLQDGTESDEFLSELMSNSSFARMLNVRSMNWFQKLIYLFNKYILKRHPKTDILKLLTSVKNLILYYNKYGANTYTRDTYTNTKYRGATVSTVTVEKTYSEIRKGIENRIKAVNRYSVKNPKTIIQLNKLRSDLLNLEAEEGTLQFIDHVAETLSESEAFLLRPLDDINPKLLNLMSKDFIGFYLPMVKGIQELLDLTNAFSGNPQYHVIKDNVDRLYLQLLHQNNLFVDKVKRKATLNLVEYLESLNTPLEFIDGVVEWIQNPINDTSIVLNWFGMISNSNNLIQQAIAKQLNDTINEVDRATLSVGIKLTNTLRKAQSKYGIGCLKLLYEKLDDGTHSGYRVKPLNYGQAKKDLNIHLEELAAKLGIEKGQDGKYIIPDDEDIKNAWYDGINEFYSKRTERRYIPEYYTLRNKMLSAKTREALDSILSSINKIVDPITIDGITYENLLSDAEYNMLQDLRKQRRLLANTYDINGAEKTGDDLLIAQELLAFNLKVNIKYKPNWDAYNKALDKVRLKYASQPDLIDLWINRNTKTQYTEEFYERLEGLRRAPLTELYEKLVKKRIELYQLFKDPTTGKVNVDMLSDRERQMLLLLDKDIAAERNPSTNFDPMTDDRFSDFAVMTYTDQYYRDYNAARRSGASFLDWYDNNHYDSGNGRMVPARYYTKLEPKDSRYIETVPTGKFTSLDPSSTYVNKNWDETGPSILPNKTYYDNSAAYNEVMNKPELKALYESIEDVMAESNRMLTFLTEENDARMPQIPARMMQILGRKNSVFNKLNYVFEEFYTTRPDDMDYTNDYEMAPNKEPIKLIPTRFIGMLNDPNTITTDAVASVIAYYNMATNFNRMRDKLDEIELLLSLLKNAEITTKSGIKVAKSSNLYQLAQLLVDRLMFGRHKKPLKFKVGNKEINASKLLDTVQEFIRKVNLSGNIWSIGTSFFTDTTYTTNEALLGRYFNKRDLAFASGEYVKQLPLTLANIGNPIPINKLGYLMLYNQIVKGNSETFSRLDQSQVLRSLNLNFWYLGYTQSDYATKSHTLLSVYHSYKFVPEEGFMSRNEYINKHYAGNKKKGEVEFEHLNTPTLYDVYQDPIDGISEVKQEYKQYITPKLLNDVRNKIEILSKRIDGTLRDVDKAAVHANSIASYLVMHKNFMISGLHDRFKHKQFNLDLGTVEKGLYRIVGNYAHNVGNFLLSLIGMKEYSWAQLLADYNNMEEYEQYAIKKTLNEFIIILGATSVAVALCSLVDGDDEYNNWFLLSVTLLALRSAFEFRTMYNPMEFMSLIKSPTAAFSTFENASSFINLVNPFSYVGDKTPFRIVDRGVYKGMPVILKNMIKVTPFKNVIEALDPKSKRSYLLNLLMNF